MNYPEQQILKILNRNFLSNPKYIINNLHIYDWESDYLAITKNLYAYEIEVKITYQDFKNDFKKQDKHVCLAGKKKVCSDIIQGYRLKVIPPNYFWYASPPNIIPVKDVPSYAGLMYVDMESNRINVIKQAPLLHKTKFDAGQHFLTDKFYYNMMTWKNRAMSKVYADPEKARKEGVREGASAVRLSAIDAFRKVCPWVDYPYDPSFPMCKNPDMNHPLKDCALQCEKGREFRKLLK